MSGPLRVVVLGLDERAKNLFRMFFRGPCQNQATIIDHENEADAFLIDLDTQQGTKILAQQREKHPDRVFITLSVKDQPETTGVVSVKKPAQAQGMTAAIARARTLAQQSAPAAIPKQKTSLFSWATRKTSGQEQAAAPVAQTPPSQKKPPVEPKVEPKPTSPPSRPPTPARRVNADLVEAAVPANSSPQDMKVVARPDRDDTAAHKVAMLLDEQGFKSYLGHRDDIDPSQPDQLASILYDPKVFLQGHVQSAIKVAFARNEPIRLETPWKSITVLPQQGLIHIQADEAQVRAACGIPFRNIVGVDIDSTSLKQVVNIKPVNGAELEDILKSPDLVRLDSFIWKIALFTSKGRLPKGVDLHQAFYLKRWPGMTRLMLPPYAMRIAALLTQQPLSLFDASRKMGIRQQYVFAFVSAAHALGLIGQQPIPVEDERPPQTEKAAASTRPERKSLFKKILSRLKLF